MHQHTSQQRREKRPSQGSNDTCRKGGGLSPLAPGGGGGGCPAEKRGTWPQGARPVTAPPAGTPPPTPTPLRPRPGSSPRSASAIHALLGPCLPRHPACAARWPGAWAARARRPSGGWPARRRRALPACRRPNARWGCGFRPTGARQLARPALEWLCLLCMTKHRDHEAFPRGASASPRSDTSLPDAGGDTGGSACAETLRNQHSRAGSQQGSGPAPPIWSAAVDGQGVLERRWRGRYCQHLYGLSRRSVVKQQSPTT